jgi:F420-non-reducing hydrogenase small subunit
MPKNEKLKIGIYWAASCGGCDVAITHINEKILDLIEAADIVFWPCAMDFKYDDLRKMKDNEMDVCLFNGAIRNSDHEELAKLIRKKSKTLIAFGACACFGGIPGLSNVTTAKESLKRAYLEEPTTPNPDKVMPELKTRVPEGELSLPLIWDTVHTLKQVVDVEYFVPGCPPTPEIIAAAVDAIASGKLPPAGAVIAGTKALCDECTRVKKNEMRVSEFKAPWEIMIDSEQCLIEQGIVCMGPATRSGCGSQCHKVNMPCRGCFGPPEGVEDQGAAMLGAIASVVCPAADKTLQETLAGLQDPLGIFYRFTLPDSMLRRTKISK